MTYLWERRVVLGLLLGMALANVAHADSVTRTRALEYDANGMLSKEIIEPDSPQMRLETVYAYDAYGNKITATTKSPATGEAAILERSAEATFDTRGRFPVSGSNALGHKESKTFVPAFGTLASSTGPNLLSTSWQYDSFGRKIAEIRADGSQTKWQYLNCADINNGSAACPGQAKYMIMTTPLTAAGAPNGPWSYTYFDSLDREVESRTLGFDGVSIIKRNIIYDNLGRVAQISQPYFSNQAPMWTSYLYDSLGRAVVVTQPNNTQSILTYDGLTTTTKNALGQSRSEIRNALGHLAAVIDAANGRLTYEYDPFGNLLKTTDPKGNTIELAYDIRGNKTSMRDPDLGTWRYFYNAVGEMVRQVDSKSQTTTMAYDKLGRLTGRAEPDLRSNWTYDACSKGIGKLCQANADNGYLRAASYDNLGRPLSMATTIDAAAYTTSVTYTASGQIATQTYPTGFTLKYVYTALGHLKEVRNNAGNDLYWSATELDAQGRMLEQSFGNNVVTQHVYDGATGHLKNIYAGTAKSVQHLIYDYDNVGNMLSRIDVNQGLSESFLYDSQRRLTSSTVNSGGAGIVTQSYDYDSLGNITKRSDMGVYTYGAVNARPHAVKEIELAAGGRRSYSYDANGNLSSEVQYDAANNVIAAKGRTANFTSFDMPQSLSAPGVSLTFAYGPEHQRSKQIAPGGTTIYLHPDNEGGLMYEKEIKSNGAVEHKHFVTIGSQVVAVVKQDGAATSVRYMHQDSLGSIVAVTDEAGTVLERFAYEPFGKRRSANGALDPNDLIKGVNTDRGYTTHEHLDELDLIHMNGRVYDPAIGRFMSADPTIPYTFNTQSFNRYSYASNNPLAYVDPSGFIESVPVHGERPFDSLKDILDYLRDQAGRRSNGGSTGRETPTDGVDNPLEPEPAMQKVEVVGKKLVKAVKSVFSDTIKYNHWVVQFNLLLSSGRSFDQGKTVRDAALLLDAIAPFTGRPALVRAVARALKLSVIAAKNGDDDGKKGPKPPKEVQDITNPPQAPVIPPDWESKPGRNGGEVYYPPGTNPADGEHIRVMPPGSSPLPGMDDGYWRWVNGNKQPIDPSTGKPGSPGQTHIPLPPDSLPPPR